VVRLCNILDPDTKLIIYKSFIMSNFDYSPLVWTFCCKSKMSKVHKMQIRALRFVHSDFSDHCMLSKYDVTSILDRNIFKILIEVFKCIHNLSPEYICDTFSICNYSHNARNKHNINYKRPLTTTYGKRCFKYVGAKL
jgi:hypothetical protein